MNVTDAVCVWDPVYRLQFIGLGRVGVREGIMLEGHRCSWGLVFPYICLAKGNLMVPVTGFGSVGLSVV